MKTGNPSIKCSVNSCAHHDSGAGECTLQTIQVGCTQSEVSRCEATECASFKLGDHGANCGCR